MSPIARLRPRIVGEARGRVLEVGVGTGLNLVHYGEGVSEVVGVEPDPHMLARARARQASARVPVELVQVGAEAMPFEPASFDTILLTWVLCTIPDVDGALREIVRVLRPEGQVLWVEHTRSRYGVMAAGQAVLNPAWRCLAGGCNLTRDPVELMTKAGLMVEGVHPRGSELSPVPIYQGTARLSR